MTSDYDNTDRLAIVKCRMQTHGNKRFCHQMLNESFHEFAVVPVSGQIRFGLWYLLKNVGHEKRRQKRSDAREALGGRFQSLEKNFVARLVPA